MLGNMNQVGGEQRQGIMQLGNGLSMLESLSRPPMGPSPRNPAFMGFKLSERALLWWVTIQQKSASLYNFST